MQYYPICLTVQGRHCVVIGGGRVAERKARGLLDHGARVTIISPQVTDSLASLGAAGELHWVDRPYQPGDLQGAFLVIAATDEPAVQQAVHQEAEERSILLNVADVPSLCNFILPATLRRGDLTVAISTGGNSPALARRLRQELEKRFGEEYEVYLNLLGAVRNAVLARGNSSAENKKVFEALLHPDFPAWIVEGCWDKIGEHLRQAAGITLDLDRFTGALPHPNAPNRSARHE